MIVTVRCQDDKDKEDEFRIDDNTLKYFDEKGIVQNSFKLEYYFSLENGGYTKKVYEGIL
jgi:hypothetical protein